MILDPKYIAIHYLKSWYILTLIFTKIITFDYSLENQTFHYFPYKGFYWIWWVRYQWTTSSWYWQPRRMSRSSRFCMQAEPCESSDWENFLHYSDYWDLADWSAMSPSGKKYLSITIFYSFHSLFNVNKFYIVWRSRYIIQ